MTNTTTIPATVGPLSTAGGVLPGGGQGGHVTHTHVVNHPSPIAAAPRIGTMPHRFYATAAAAAAVPVGATITTGSSAVAPVPGPPHNPLRISAAAPSTAMFTASNLHDP